MNNKFIWLSIVAVILSFIGGFLLANALNRSEIDRLTAENTRLQKEVGPRGNKPDELNLTDEELRAKIKEADEKPDDFAVQKGLGLALYSYAGMKQDEKLLDDVEKLLERAYKLNPNDYQVTVSLGNIYYDLGQIKKDNQRNLKAKEIYEKALEKNEKDTNVLTSYGLTFLFDETPERKKAIEQFEKTLAVDSRNEKALFYMTQAQIEENNQTEANKYLVKLKEVNPENQSIPELENKLTQNKN